MNTAQVLILFFLTTIFLAPVLLFAWGASAIARRTHPGDVSFVRALGIALTMVLIELIVTGMSAMTLDAFGANSIAYAPWILLGGLPISLLAAAGLLRASSSLPLTRCVFATSLSLLLAVVLSTAIFFLPRFAGVTSVVLFGDSMLPSIGMHDVVFIDGFTPRFSSYVRGDVIAYHAPQEPGALLVHRVIGLPGESVTIRAGRITINGALLDEPYLDPANTSGPDAQFVVPEGTFVVLSDNRRILDDSRVIGAISFDRIVGRSLGRAWRADDNLLHRLSPDLPVDPGSTPATSI